MPTASEPYAFLANSFHEHIIWLGGLGLRVMIMDSVGLSDRLIVSTVLNPRLSTKQNYKASFAILNNKV